MISVDVGDGKNVPDIPGASTTRNYVYLVRGPSVRYPSHTLLDAGVRDSQSHEFENNIA